MTSSKEKTRILLSHLKLLNQESSQQSHHEISSTPIINASVLADADSLLSPERDGKPIFPQYGLLAGQLDKLVFVENFLSTFVLSKGQDPRLFYNTAAPSSTFICGSQGSGKSHTLSCLLESCLLPSDASKLSSPLAGLIFHYDSFISDRGGTPCEAAFLSSNPEIRVRVLCAPTSFRTIERTYSELEYVSVEPLRIREADLNTKRMLDLMAVNGGDGPMPLYMHTVNRILREMRLIEQETGGGFRYQDFRNLVMDADLTPAQLGPLTQRLDTLESFMPLAETMKEKKKGVEASGKKSKKLDKHRVAPLNQWATKPGTLTIVDLSCPCVTAETASSLFNICLGLFLEQDAATGRVIALDEAHKYMNSSPEAMALTDTLLSTIRLQRHLGARVIISTQEPTISPALLDLSSVTIVHRFTSPEWFRALKGHLAAASLDLMSDADEDSDDGDSESSGRGRRGMEGDKMRLFKEIVELGVGQALLFAPSAVVELEKQEGEEKVVTKRLGGEFLRIKVRARLTADGGRSVMAT